MTREAALIMPSWPRGRPPLALTPSPPWCSDAWSAPVTVTSPEGGAGTLAVAAGSSASPGSQPRTTGSALAPSAAPALPSPLPPSLPPALSSSTRSRVST
ncbi:hypothetical protein Z951_26125 [Streptomyces sp. PRh5]|nr:hypothetical protein Z951_26125 [Streptomyces sp. PRh5]